MTPHAIYELSQSGMSMSEIGMKIGKTRSAIAGIIYRYRKKLDVVETPVDPVVIKPEPAKPAKLPPMDVSSFAEVLEHNRCRYIEGDMRKGNAVFCKEAASRNGFCEAHRAICYMKVRKK